MSELFAQNGLEAAGVPEEISPTSVGVKTPLASPSKRIRDGQLSPTTDLADVKEEEEEDLVSSSSSLSKVNGSAETTTSEDYEDAEEGNRTIIANDMTDTKS